LRRGCFDEIHEVRSVHSEIGHASGGVGEWVGGVQKDGRCWVRSSFPFFPLPFTGLLLFGTGPFFLSVFSTCLALCVSSICDLPSILPSSPSFAQTLLQASIGPLSFISVPAIHSSSFPRHSPCSPAQASSSSPLSSSGCSRKSPRMRLFRPCSE
jgi:hypothetical protein